MPVSCNWAVSLEHNVAIAALMVPLPLLCQRHTRQDTRPLRYPPSPQRHTLALPSVLATRALSLPVRYDTLAVSPADPCVRDTAMCHQCDSGPGPPSDRVVSPALD